MNVGEPEPTRSSVFSKTAGQAGIYTLGNILRNSVSIVMLPIYTRYLLPEDYGVIELLTMALDLAGIMFANRIGEALFRFYSAAKDQSARNTVISTAIYLSLMVNTAAFIFLFALSSKITPLIFGSDEYRTIFVLFAISLITQEVGIIPLNYFRAAQRPWWFFTASLVRLVLQVSVNLYFVVFLEMHVLGVVYGTLIVSSLMAVVLVIIAFRQCGFAIDRTLIWRMIKFSIPFVFSTAGAFFVTFGDRFFLRAYHGLHEVGIYSLAYRFGFLFTIIAWDPFSKIWDSQRYEVAKLKSVQDDFRKIFVLLTVAATFIATGIALFVPDILRVMAAENFYAAAAIVPYVVFAFIPWIWSNFCNFGILWSNQTRYFAYAEGATVVVAAIAYATLIPRFGSLGAAISTIFAYLMRLIVTRYFSQRLYPIALPMARASSIVAVGVLLAVVGLRWLTPGLADLPWRIVLVITFPALILTTSLLQGDERNMIIAAYRKVLRRR